MSTKDVKVGVIITRGQPFHKGHIAMMTKAIEENDIVLTVIGSANKAYEERNPLPIGNRMRLFFKVLNGFDENIRQRLHYITLDDWSSDNNIPYESSIGSNNSNFESVSSDWGLYLYYNIVNAIKCKTFTLYYNDDKKIVENWFPFFLRERIQIVSTDRIDGYSSSEVRKAFAEGNMEYLKDALPYLSTDEINELGVELLK